MKAPSLKQLEEYEKKEKKVVAYYTYEDQYKTLVLRSGGGRVFFDFIDTEYDAPKTKEEAKKLEEEIKIERENRERRVKSKDDTSDTL